MLIELPNPSYENTYTINDERFQYQIRKDAFEGNAIYYVYRHEVYLVTGSDEIKTDILYYDGKFVRKI